MKQSIKALLLVLLVSVLAFTMIACDYDFGTLDVLYTFDDDQGNVTRLTIKAGETLEEKDLPAAPAAPAEDEYFLGWFTEDGTEVKAGDVAPEGVTAVAAKAVYGKATVKFVLGDQEIEKIVKPGSALAASDFPATYVPADTVFLGWFAGEEEVAEGYVVDEDITVVAKYAAITVDLTFVIGEESNTGKFNINAVLTDADFPAVEVPDHQRFEGWYVGGTKIAAGYRVTGDTVVTAVFADATVDITFNMNGERTTRTYDEGTALTAVDFPEVFVPAHHIFKGWFIGENPVEVGYQVYATQTISAVFEEMTKYTLTFTVNGFNAPATFYEGDMLTAEDFPNALAATPAHFTFVGWFIGATPVAAGYEVTKDVQIEARYLQITHDVTYVINGSVVTKTYAEGKILTASDLDAPAAPAHQRFVGWFVGGEKIAAGYEVAANVTITAVYEDILNTVTFVVGETETPVVVKEGTVLTEKELAAPEAPAHTEFVGWTVNGKQIGVGYEVTSDVYVIANFREIVYTVTFVENGETSTREFKDAYVLTAKDFPTYTTPAHTTFEGWFAGEDKVEAGYVVTADVTLTAVFKDITFKVTVVIGEESTESIVKEGTVIELIPESEIDLPEHTTFEGWFIGDVQVTESFELTADVVLTAKIVPVPQYDVTFVVNGENNVVTFYKGDVLTEEDFPEVVVGENETFEGWFIAENEVKAGYIVEGAVTIVAAVENLGETPVIQIVELTFVVGENRVVKSVANGSTLGAILYTPAAEVGMKFAGWKNADDEFVTAEDVVEGAMTLTAEFTEDVYYIHFVIAGVKTSVKVATGTKIAAEAIPEIPEQEDAQIIGFVDANGTPFNAETIYNEDVTFTAKYQSLYYYVTFVNGEEKTVVKVLIAEDAKLTAEQIPTAAAEGKIFVGYVDAEGKAVAAGRAVTADVTFTASFVTFPEGAVGTLYYGEWTVVIGTGSISLRGTDATGITYNAEENSFSFKVGEKDYVFTTVEGGYAINGTVLTAELPEDTIPESPIIVITNPTSETPAVGV